MRLGGRRFTVLGGSSRPEFAGVQPWCRHGRSAESSDGQATATPELLRAEEERRLLEFGVGLTSSGVRPTRAAAELTREERQEGAERVLRSVSKLRPRDVALLGLTLYPVFFPTGAEPGPGLKVQRLAGAQVFVLPNPSGRNRVCPGFEKKLLWFRALAQAVHGSKP